MPASHPEKIGKYTIVKILGRGAMGMVYEGYDPIIDRKVAIKVINKSGFDDYELKEAMDRFKREAQAAGKLSHANIVMVYEYGEEEDTAFISMEYVDGRTLQEIMAEDELTIGQVQTFARQLLDGLHYAHSHQVIHRDIKPANLVYTGEGQIKIMDFGIARVESSSLTQVGTIMGTPAYMAPELFTGDTVDHRTDLFAVAVILYQLLTGIKPFTGETLSIIMHQVVNIQPPQPSELNNKLPKSLDNLIRRGLSKPLENRFTTASEFKQELNRSFKKVAPDTRIPLQNKATPTDPTIMTQRPTSSLPLKQFKPLYGLLAIALVILLVCTLIFFAKGSHTPPASAINKAAHVVSPPPRDTTKLPPKEKKILPILKPVTTKIMRTPQQPPPIQPQEQSQGISINGNKANNNEYRSGTGISITTPSRD